MSVVRSFLYSVATPFHPFGGAVDVIVVQQQDGTFRSTPWYVRFGKFQGVLKGAEKMVRITVNGVEANFQMCLDNSGEAYFIREVESGKQSDAEGVLKDNHSENNGEVYRLEHSISDSGISQLQVNYDSSGGSGLERTESDGSHRYYDFQDEQTSPEGSVRISEYGSSCYDNLDVEHFGESQGSDSEVVLVSVDGHILTAPVSASEQETENVQLSVPQFHIAPGDGTEFCEGNTEFTSADNVWADYIGKMDSDEANGESNKVCSTDNDDNAFDRQLEVCEGPEGPVCQKTAEAQNDTFCDSENVADGAKREDVFSSCLELSELGQRDGSVDFEGTGPVFEALQHSSEESSPQAHNEVDKPEDGGVVETRNDDRFSLSNGSNSTYSPVKNGSQYPVKLQMAEESSLVKEHLGLERTSVDSTDSTVYSELKDELLSTAITEGIDDDVRCPDTVVRDREGETMKSNAATSTEEINRACESVGFEISLCKDELRPGMGRIAAAQVFDEHSISLEEYKHSATSILESENLVVRIGERYLPWAKAAPIVLGKAAFDIDLPIEPNDAIPVEQDETMKPKNGDTVITPSSTGSRWRLWPIPFRRVKTIEHTSNNTSSEDVFLDSESGIQNPQAELMTVVSENRFESPRKQIVRTNVPTSEQIASLNLKDGQNMVTFSFSTRVLGKQQVDAHIYLWKWNARIVISDVDGTITKSDVLGQFMPLVGKDWTQSGVAKLFSAIKENGYQLLFLSARAIVQAYLTRSFLLNLKQDGKALPNGPVVISPDGLFPALFREVIRRAPHEFKIACLEDIRKLFPPDYNPFYAGFGNRDTDELSYRKIGIPKGKIFIINPKGEVATSHRMDVKSYTSLHTLVNDMFPPTSLVEQEDFNSWNFWKTPLEEVD